MNRLLFAAAFLLGALAVTWMGLGFAGSNNLAFIITVVIGGVYIIGFIELVQFRQATATLSGALGALPVAAGDKLASLDEWLARLHPSLHNSVRLRIEGERVGLPAPAITPYLVGLLVMLGLLGTFAGMVETLRGAVFALEGTTELQAIRAGLAAPIEGLSLAFGTSVAGVAASAMLGLAATLSRRDRMLETRRLDGRIASVFRDFSLIHNRQETYKALQMQARTLPEVSAKLHELAVNLEAMGDRLGDRLLANQEHFHQSVQALYTELASSVDRSLKESLAESGRQAGESISPLLRDAMTAVSTEARNTHQHMNRLVAEQLTDLSGRFSDTSTEVANAWREGLAGHQQSNRTLVDSISDSLDAFNGRFERAAAAMLEAFDQTASSWLERQAEGDDRRLERWSSSLEQSQASAGSELAETSRLFAGELGAVAERQQAAFTATAREFESMSATLTGQWLQASERMDRLTATLQAELSALRTDEENRGQAAVARLSELEATVASHLATLGRELEAPMTRLIQTASETPRAAAEVIGQLREEISNTIERDNSLLEERRRLMEELAALSLSLEQASAGQREAIEKLVESSTGMMRDVGERFAGQVDAELARANRVTENLAGSATEMASLGEAFGLAVAMFNEANDKLIDSLSRIESAMGESTSRSDEQMGYYVAQAREIIDQSMSSQREIFEELRQLGRQDDCAPAEAG